MSAKWAPGHSKTVMSRLKTHVFPLIGASAIVDLDTHDLMQPLEAIKKRGTIDVALRVQNYLQSIMREAKRLRLITINLLTISKARSKPRGWYIAPLYPYRDCRNCRSGSTPIKAGHLPV